MSLAPFRLGHRNPGAHSMKRHSFPCWLNNSDALVLLVSLVSLAIAIGSGLAA